MSGLVPVAVNSVFASAAGSAAGSAASAVVDGAVNALLKPSTVLPHSINQDVDLDPIASILALAIIGASREENVKMERIAGRLVPVSPQQSVQAIPFGSYLPSMLQRLNQAAKRHFSDSSRKQLNFFDRAIPFVQYIYPICPGNPHNKVLKSMWEYVMLGITLLKRSYSDDPGLQSQFDRWNLHIRQYLGAPEIKVPNHAADLDDQKEERLEEQMEKSRHSSEPKEVVDSEVEAVLREALVRLEQIKSAREGGHVQDVLSVERRADGQFTEELIEFLKEACRTHRLPDKLCKISDKIKEIWTEKELSDFVINLDGIKNAHDKRQEEIEKGYLAIVHLKLDEQAAQYVKIATLAISKMFST